MSGKINVLGGKIMLDGSVVKADSFPPFDKMEELHPELKACLENRGGIPYLRHKWVISPFHNPMFNAMVNQSYLHKSKRVDEAFKERDWASFVFLHERPYRAQAMLEILHHLTATRPGWSVIESVWTDSEFPYVNRKMWAMVFGHENARWMMDEEDADTLNHLPDEILIWRGCSKKHVRGFSWSLSEEKARWFATRFDYPNPVLCCRCVRKEDVVAYLSGRGEKEILIHPRIARSIATVSIKPL